MQKKDKLISILLFTCLFQVFLANVNVFSEASNESVIEKAHLLKRLIQEKAAKGQDVSMALDLDKKSQLAAQEGNIGLVNKLLSDAINILEDNVSSETTKESAVEVNKAPSEITNRSLVEKAERLKKLIQENAAKGQDISMALYLDRKSQLAVKEGDFNLADKLLSNAIKTLEDLTNKFPAKKIIELPVKADKVIVTDGVPKYQTGQEVKEYKDAFNTKTILANGGKVRLEITSTPIYVEAEPTTTELKIKTEYSPFGLHPGYTYKKIKIDRKRINWITSTRPQEIGFDYKYSLDIGVKWNRPEVYAVWDIIQKTDKNIEKNIYDWEITDYIYGNVPKGINIVANIDVTENRILSAEMPFPKTFKFKTKYLEEKYIAFVKKLVERYDGDSIDDMPSLQNPVRYWQVFNEPDLASKDWEGYVHLLEITYKAIKEACPECKVVIGGMSLFPEGFNKFYIPILKKLKGKYIDVFDFHQFGESWVWMAYEDIISAIKNGLSENEYTNTEIWITETGTYSGKPENSRKQTEKEQAEALLKRYVCAMSLDIKKIFWAFGLIEGCTDGNGEFDHTGLIYDGKDSDDLGYGEKKLAYYTYKMMTEKLEGCNLPEIERLNLDERICAYRFTKQNKPVYVIWAQ